MTREEAIAYFKRHIELYCVEGVCREAEEMAIKALEQEPKYCDRNICIRNEHNGIGCGECEVTKSQEPCEDAISRQAVLDGVDRYIYKSQSTGTQDDFYSFAELVVKQLPSVTPQPKTGHWEWVQYDYNPKLGNWHCSECRCVVVESVDKNEKGGIPLYKYCPQCGTKMVELQGSEDKE